MPKKDLVYEWSELQRLTPDQVKSVKAFLSGFKGFAEPFAPQPARNPCEVLTYDWASLGRLDVETASKLVAILGTAALTAVPGGHKLARPYCREIEAAQKDDLILAEVEPNEENASSIRVVWMRPQRGEEPRAVFVDLRLLPAPPAVAKAE